MGSIHNAAITCALTPFLYVAAIRQAIAKGLVAFYQKCKPSCKQCITDMLVMSYNFRLYCDCNQCNTSVLPKPFFDLQSM